MKGGSQHFPELFKIVVDESKPNILVVYIVMEYFEMTLTSLLESKLIHKLTLEKVVSILYQLLAALNFLATARVLHRDIKPENILVDKEFNVKLCDFGLARYYRKSA